MGPGSRGLLLALAIPGVAGQATAQDAAAHAEAYRACPAGGVAFWMAVPRRIQSPEGHRDAGSPLVEGFGIDVRWADGPDWIEPKAVPDEVLRSRATWVRPASLIDRHHTIHRTVGGAVPQGRPRILLAERTEHWAWRWESSIAVRNADGVWSVEYIKLYDDETSERANRTLGAAASRRLDDLIADPCLAREPFTSDWTHIQSSDDTHWTLEVETADETIRISGRVSGFGRAGAINHLLQGGSAE